MKQIKNSKAPFRNADFFFWYNSVQYPVGLSPLYPNVVCGMYFTFLWMWNIYGKHYVRICINCMKNSSEWTQVSLYPVVLWDAMITWDIFINVSCFHGNQYKSVNNLYTNYSWMVRRSSGLWKYQNYQEPLDQT